MRLIDADALKEQFSKAGKDYNHEYIIEMLSALETINNAPTVEAYTPEQVKELVDLNKKLSEERPQGKWLKHDTWDYSCSLCDSYSFAEDGMVETLPNFCPNCGAKMQRLKGGRE